LPAILGKFAGAGSVAIWSSAANLRPMQRRAYLAGAGAAVVAGLGGCLGFLEDDYDVGMSPMAFEPRELTVEIGSTVVWQNTSSRGHTVTAYEGAIPEDAKFFATGGFDSEQTARDAWNTLTDEDGIIGPGEQFEHTFEVAGRHDYYCIPHETEGMTGAIVGEE
jgi:plastocyanin